ncbi:Hvo_1808 family surface protein [Halomicroarcula sp. F13]|uniref:Hvo_1808 family surface protein n=1 Tax=Haloarcula rubra TaxID=2487747 RepID=A0AAW4PR77_9EURY|nr:Hvo_1808 family surface protein [Halomicroarcula rubra]MBX0322792.1 Hvo_1808 family surface protein [Halomicroarcula rubra]
MRRQSAVLLCAVALLLTGCQGFGSSLGSPDQTATPSPTADEVFTLELDTNESDGDDRASETAPPDPETDVRGWENGVWHNETLAVTTEDGLNESEREAVVARSMARVEFVRELEFERTVPVTVVSREEYRNQSRGGDPGESLRRFDNAKFEALFLVGEDRDSIAVQRSQLGSSVLGYYSSSREAIVVVSDAETPTIAESTLAHELVHALQDQRFGLDSDARTRDAIQGRNGLVEGDAVATTDDYTARCGVQWECLPSAAGGGGGGDRHFGIGFLLYFPYSDGAGLVEDLRDRGGWAAVNDAYDETPDGAREVVTPAEYPDWEPRDVTLADRSTDEWERVRPSTDRARPDYAVVGPSAIAATAAYTLADDYNESAVVTQRDVFNYDGNGLDDTDPYNYALPATTGWDGGRMHVYTNGSETAYVWRTAWETEADAAAFARTWTAVLAHWGGTQTADETWVLAESSPFTDAVAVHVSGDTVTVVNAPTESELNEVYDA